MMANGRSEDNYWLRALLWWDIFSGIPYLEQNLLISRIVVLIAFWTVTLSVSASGLNDRLRNCRSLDADAERLRCYDELVDERLPGTTSAGVVTTDEEVTVDAEGAEEISPEIGEETNEDFGLEHRQRDGAEVMSAIVAEVHSGPFDRLVIRLSNDQIWQQVNTGRFRMERGQKVVIRRGVLNSFFLHTEGSNREIRVKRVR